MSLFENEIPTIMDLDGTTNWDVGRKEKNDGIGDDDGRAVDNVFSKRTEDSDSADIREGS